MPASAGTKPLKKLKPGMGLYQVIYWPAEAKKAGYPDKPWAVVNLQTRDVNGRWHRSKEEALAQARALYAKLGDKAKVHGEDVIHNAFFLFADAATLVAADGVKWVEAIGPKTYKTPAYGEVVVTSEKINNFINGINTYVRGQDIAINYEHGIDTAKGAKAAGWIKQARMNDRGNLELAIDFTEPAKEEIKNGEWKYFSLEWDDEWEHPDGIIYTDVVMGGALTNRPIAKGLMPINFSEIFTEKEQLDAKIQNGGHLREEDPEKEFAVWSTAYVNDLPDSAFLYIDSGGNRYLPYKDKNGKIDLPHLRNAAARVNQVKDIPAATVEKIKARISRMLGAKNMSEVLEIDAESKEWEHSAPGTGSPPIPRTDEDGSDDPAIGGGWRRATPPDQDLPAGPDNPSNQQSDEVTITFSEAEAVGYLTSAVAGLRRIHTNHGDHLIEDIERLLAVDRRTRSFNELQRLTNEVRTYLRSSNSDTKELSEGGNTVGELTDKDLLELRHVLDVDDDAKIVEAVKHKFGELAALRDAVSASEQERLFAEQYPQFYDQHMKLMERDRKNAAHSFSESVSQIKKAEGFGLKTTKQGLSTSCLEKIEEVHVKFSENKATFADFEDVIKSIVHGGIVQFGELGTNNDDELPEIDTNSAPGVANARKLFAEVVNKIQRENPDWEYMQCVTEASKKHPDLADIYKVTLPA